MRGAARPAQRIPNRRRSVCRLVHCFTTRSFRRRGGGGGPCV